MGPDWTCILVAFDSGYVRFYTEICQLLFEEQFHSENITSVKCQSQHGPRPDICLNLKPEEIYIQYQSNMVILNGNQLFPYLKICRSHLAIGNNFFIIYIVIKYFCFYNSFMILFCDNKTYLMGRNLLKPIPKQMF